MAKATAHPLTRRLMVMALTLTVCGALAAPKVKRVRAQQTVPLGSFTGRTGPMDILPGDKTRVRMTGGVYIESPTGNLAGDEMVVTMGARDLETAEATGHVKIRTRQPGNRVITSTGDKGTLNNLQKVAILTGNVTVRVEDPQTPMLWTNVGKATVSLDTKVVHLDPPANGQIHFEGTTPARATKK